MAITCLPVSLPLLDCDLYEDIIKYVETDIWNDRFLILLQPAQTLPTQSSWLEIQVFLPYDEKKKKKQRMGPKLFLKN